MRESEALTEWRDARRAFLELPAGSDKAREALNRLSNAENALFTCGPTPSDEVAEALERATKDAALVFRFCDEEAEQRSVGFTTPDEISEYAQEALTASNAAARMKRLIGEALASLKDK